MIDINKIRNDTPGLDGKLFFNSAGSSLPPMKVMNCIREYLKQESMYGGYKLVELWKDELERFYSQSAKLINAQSHNMAFAHDATDAYTKALSSIPFQNGDVILTTDDDYVSNYLNFLSLHKRYGVQIKRIENLDNGELDLNDAQEKLHQYKPVLVSVTHIPTNSGLIQDVQAVGKLCSETDTVYIVDACQSVGQIPIDVQQIECDFLSITGRKFLRGPRGTGFLYVSDRMLESNKAPLFIDLRGATWIEAEQMEIRTDAKRFETWESPYALIYGMTAAMDYSLELGISEIQKRNHLLAMQLRNGLGSISNIRLLDKGKTKGSIITVAIHHMDFEKFTRSLDNHDVYYSTVDKQSAQFDFSKKKVERAIRLSPHYFNTIEEVDNVLNIISDII